MNTNRGVFIFLDGFKIKKNSQDALSFGFTEMTAQNIIKRNLSKLDDKISPRLIRKYRIIHLIENYDFSPHEIAAFTGWSFSSMFKSIGIDTSSKKNYYEEQWRDYVAKLLVPLESFLKLLDQSS